MIFQIKSFSTIRISTSDVSKSRNWYKSLFGQDPIEDLESFVSFKIGDTCFDISLADSKSPVSTGGSVGYWLVDNMDSLLNKVNELGGKVYRGPLRVSQTLRVIVQIQDPVGNVIGFEAPLK